MYVGVRRPVSVGLVSLCVVVGVLVLGVASAAAAPGYANVCAGSAFCTEGSGNPFGLAVDNSSNFETVGDVYVARLNGSVMRLRGRCRGRLRHRRLLRHQSREHSEHR
jgi:hypothetical protein